MRQGLVAVVTGVMSLLEHLALELLLQWPESGESCHHMGPPPDSSPAPPPLLKANRNKRPLI